MANKKPTLIELLQMSVLAMKTEIMALYPPAFNSGSSKHVNRLNLHLGYLSVKKLLLIIVIIIASLNFVYTFGYRGEPMSQLEFLSRTLGSIILLVFSRVQLNKVTTKP